MAAELPLQTPLGIRQANSRAVQRRSSKVFAEHSRKCSEKEEKDTNIWRTRAFSYAATINKQPNKAEMAYAPRNYSLLISKLIKANKAAGKTFKKKRQKN